MSLRITGGKLRGRKIGSPTGRSIRPTLARVREAVFDQLLHRISLRDTWPVDSIRTIDVFAGSGIMGFETISRVNSHVTFVENNRNASQAIEYTATLLGVTDRTTIINTGVETLGQALQACHVAFLDPPYHSEKSASSLCVLAEQGWLKTSAIIVIETSRDESEQLPAGFNQLDSRNYGSTKITFLEWAAG